ncbi:hypothetical protein [Micromonospora sagamiensis]|uniref:Uncharacterized protein n=1 Tax=Micromonospora sagamiensis TaxID=47875 RepID=A0A562WKH0_9ACTN|nr:hypothetical protein [Micromonospora sagamiensis]TWJ30682.1 hypothetical protein JD81_04228 [Micromonospora sagamiensis]BCL16285.1 hypothetical protein GCM10017556_40240 [Micromonospora sagamiensis]
MLRTGVVLVLGGATASVAGCGLLDRDDPPPPPDPLTPLVDGALALAARYRAAIDADPALTDRLTPIAEAHRAHATELAAAIGMALPSPSPSAPAAGPTGDAATVLAELRADEERGRAEAATFCAQAPADRAALVGSIAAARATHVEVLR